MQRVLVLCTGNSCRSIMAEALINHLGEGRFKAASAGSNPAGQVHPRALETLQRHGIATSQSRSKSWEEFYDQPFDTVITVCDQAAGSCPVFPGKYDRLHWSTPDPAAVEAGEQEIDAAFEETFLSLRKRIEEDLL